ncbi:hypothetical protein T492DRAFT_602498, partial [Pavlovales sp. CCMP2436]
MVHPPALQRRGLQEKGAWPARAPELCRRGRDGAKCAKPDMVDVVHRRCSGKGCMKKASGQRAQPSFADETGSDMVDVVHRRCSGEGCKNKASGQRAQPSFADKGAAKALYCKTCAKPGMVDVINPRC